MSIGFLLILGLICWIFGIHFFPRTLIEAILLVGAIVSIECLDRIFRAIEHQLKRDATCSEDTNDWLDRINGNIFLIFNEIKSFDLKKKKTDAELMLEKWKKEDSDPT